MKSTDSGNKNFTATEKQMVPSSNPVKDVSKEEKMYMCECVQLSFLKDLFEEGLSF